MKGCELWLFVDGPRHPCTATNWPWAEIIHETRHDRAREVISRHTAQSCSGIITLECRDASNEAVGAIVGPPAAAGESE